MVLVGHAGTRIASAGEAEAGREHPVVAQTPVRDVAVPAGLHLAHQAQLVVLVP